MESSSNEVAEDFDAPIDKRVVYDEIGRVQIIVEARSDRSLTAAEILHAVEFLHEHWDDDEREE